MSVWTPFCEFCGTQLVSQYNALVCPHCGARFDEAMFVINQPVFPGRATRKVQREKLVERDKYTSIASVMEVVNGAGDSGGGSVGDEEQRPQGSDDGDHKGDGG